MCGIAGFVGRGDLSDLKRMNAAQRHRGPDGEGTYVDAEHRVYLGHQRLAVIDIAGGHQPMWTADGQLGIVFNGEIYNHRELRQVLQASGNQFQTDHSDTEVLLHAYRQWGESFVERLNGMWAFVIYDRSRRKLFGSRDRFGKKPFYYTVGSDLFAFASELTALSAHPQTPSRVSRLALKKYFAYGYIPAPHAYLEGVSKLPGGHSFTYEVHSRQLRVWPYWTFNINPDPALEHAKQEMLEEELVAILDRAVRRRMIADVPVGVFLSGGIDSSSVAAYASKHSQQAAISTFSIGFDEPTFDESRYATLASKHVGSKHHNQIFSDTVARSWLPDILSRLDEPMGDSSLLPTWLLCQHARKHVTVALGGDGADELFAGYDPFLALRWAKLYQQLVPRTVHSAIALICQKLPVSHRNMSFDFKVKRTLRGLDFPPHLWCPIWMAPLLPKEIACLLREPVAEDELYSEAIDAWDQCHHDNPVSRLSQFYARLYLQDDILTKVDRASMAHSLEVRTPFLDIEMVDFARKLPPRWKLHAGQTKVLLKSALRHTLPAEILQRPKKGFGVPVGRWFRDGALAAPPTIGAGLDNAFLHQRVGSHKLGQSDERAFLWCAYLIAHHT